MPELTTHTHFTPTSALRSGETITARFHADRPTYWREHAWIAALFMGIGMAILWLIGNPHVWTGAIGGLAAVAVRAGYLASDELKMEWVLTDSRLLGPGTRSIPLDNIATMRRLLSAVQIIDAAGDKHLMKYRADPQDIIDRIDRARARP
jgi:hypothetical protein